ncbi:MAG TPA: GGDEF domain-containing protein [Spirochaetota bacterium]|nr:GGDEF domain-containing protein [Spirochaetota bacterium]HPC39896.1 GGDEF domain-containing protein [Spirochaetota bacterium]HPL18290.1 GGDEF domain-containing protein [Spirochaetota bacterium]HQJ71514.1 GGDEF domain-containing protein [Spirochaetota bacterium]
MYQLTGLVAPMLGRRQEKRPGDYQSTSPYAAELRKGFPFLLFSGEIESEFRKSYCKMIRPQFISALIAAFILIVAFEIMDHVFIPDRRVIWTTVVRFGVILPVLALSGLASTVKRFQFAIFPLVFASSLVGGLGIIAIFHINYHSAGYVRYESLILTTAIVYFLSGLLFRMSLACCGLVMAAYFAVAVLTGVSAPVIASSGLFLVLMNVIGAGGCYIIERAIRSNYLHRKILKEMAEHDGLTGIYNRHTFNENYGRLWRQAVRDRKAVAVIMIDVDQFKQYNDTRGHLAGDRCLIQIAGALARYERRPLDIVARFGGEEFVVVLYDTDASHVRDASEQIRAGIADLRIEHGSSDAGPFVTVSVGSAIMVPGPAIEPQWLIRLADEALYRAKGLGRNRVEMSSDYQG